MNSHENQEFNDLKLAFWKSEEANRHIAARLAALESVCIEIAARPELREAVQARLLGIIATCNRGNSLSSEPDQSWPLEEHYMRRLAGFVVT